VQFTDRLTIDRSHRTSDGYLRVTAKAARSGIQQYRGAEIDPEGKHFAADQVVNVYRPAEEVFDAKAVASFVGRPITDDHPSVAVTAQNWRDHSRGVVGGAVKDGEWIRFDLALMDAPLIEKVDGGKRELSAGYACELAIEDGEAPDGTKYQAVQRTIRGNHVAVVDKARAGSEARIADGGNKIFEHCDFAPVILIADEAQEQSTMKDFLTLDGLKVDLSDVDAVKAAVAKLQTAAADANKAKDTAEGQVAALTTDKATLEAKVTTLEQQLVDAKVTPAQLRDAAASFAKVQDQAKKLGVEVTDAMDEPALKKAAVSAKLGDAAKDWTDAQIDTSFATLVAQLGDDDKQPVQPFKAPAVVANDAEVATAYGEMVKHMQDASKPKPAQAA
jgi:uncharacterized protein